MVGEVIGRYRRAILIFLIAIVGPSLALLWLGIRSFQRQREATQILARQNVEATLRARTLEAAAAAFADRSHPFARAFFTMADGRVVEPANIGPSPLPDFTPPRLADADRLERSGRITEALASYRRLLGQGVHPPLVLSRIARCLVKLGRTDEARATWRRLATSHPDALDLSHRPFGLVAAVESGDIDGLADQIVAGRWNLHADQAIFFLGRLDPDQAREFASRVELARLLQERFRPVDPMVAGQIYSLDLSGSPLFYRSDGPNRIRLLESDTNWIETSLRPGVERDLELADNANQDIVIYGSTTGLIILILTAGIVLLVRDLSREARTNRVRSDLVSGVSHELKTPITLIRLYGETLLHQGALSTADREDFYRIITRESTRLGRLVERVLTFSRMERGDHQYAFEVDDPSSVVAGVVGDYREWLASEGFDVDLVVPPEPILVRFDRAALSQAVVNLVDNAVKYSGTSRRIAVRMDGDDAHAIIEVEDHGIGIEPRECSRVFDRFYRGNDPNRPGGYGLGLYMVRQIAEAHGGRVDVDSVRGQGSIFRLTLPRVSS